MDKPKSDKSPTNWVLVVAQLVLIVTFAALVPWAIATGSNFGPFQQQITFIVISLLGALLLTWTSSAAIEYVRNKSLKAKFTGSVAITIAIYCLLVKYAPEPASKNVRLRLLHDGRILDTSFSIILYPPGDLDPIHREGFHGEATIEIPSGLSEISDATLTCTGYKLLSKPPFKIFKKVVTLDVIEDGPDPPSVPDTLPSPEKNPDFPTEEDCQKPPAIEDASQIVFECVNNSGQPVIVQMYDCTAHWRHAGKKDGVSPWLEVRLSSSAEPKPFNRFTPGSGWFYIYLVDAKGTKFNLGPHNLYQKPTTTLTISQTSDKLAGSID